MRAYVWVAVACLWMSGCQSTPTEGPAISAGEGGNSPFPEWGVLPFTAAGAAGDWLVAYHPLPGPVDMLHYEVAFHVESASPAGTPLGFYFFPPAPVTDCGDGSRLGNAFQYPPPTLSRPEGGASAWSYEASGGQGGSCLYTGLVFGVGSTHAWSLNLSYRLRDGPAVQPLQVWTGSGAIYVPRAARIPPVTSHPAGHLELEAILPEPGWTHVEFTRPAPAAAGARTLQGEFPDGQRFDNVGYRVAGGSSMLERMGTFTGRAGTFSASAAYVDADTSLDLSLLHFTGAVGPLPIGVRPGYYYSY